MYIFSKKGSQYPSWNYSPVNPYTTDRYIRNNANMVTLSVSYSADFGSIFRSGSRSLNNSRLRVIAPQNVAITDGTIYNGLSGFDRK